MYKMIVATLYWVVTDRLGNDMSLNDMTFVDPATGCLEIIEIPDRTSGISEATNQCHIGASTPNT